ncbi:flagellar assembly protein FliW [Paenibacillus protaetiae]|nr:flagellar assembly protein FliW [Paenibacillus protaetiae]
MSTITTTRFGELQLADYDRIYFEAGIPGFKEYKSYIKVLLEESPFMFLQSAEAGELAFILVSPFDFFPDYEFDLSESVIHELGLQSKEDVEVWNVVTVRESLEHATANLAAPIVMNKKTGQAQQYILQDAKYSIKQRLFQSKGAGGE